VDENVFVLDILLQQHRDTEAAKTFLTRLLGEYDVPEVIQIDQLRSYAAAIREIPSLINVDHQQVISTARCNNIIEQRASVASRAVLPKPIPPSYTASGRTTAEIQAAETRSRIPEPARPDHQPPPPFPHQCLRRN
jgi:transposase-like protein